VAVPEMKLALLLALYTGQRQGDLLRLPWSAYDGAAITLRQSKGGQTVRVPCTRKLRAALDAAPRRAPIILTTKTGRAFRKRYFARLWEETCKAAGITDLHFHDLRGTTVTALAQAGCTVPEIAAITGHTLRSAQAILDKYLARTSQLGDNAIQNWENAEETDSAKRPAKQEGGSEVG